ncbi:glycosyltransferase [Providencia rettgeri]|nr:glycosyltransferase [Providencia rettgeri]QPE17513.1 glycosyltransferase [Providencia rettgeri]
MLNFSVLLSVYKNENPIYLNEAIESIYDNQDIKPTEIVLVKDGPLTDELNIVIESWKTRLHNTLKIIDIPTNVGLGNALNLGLKECSYDWVMRMDTDDISTPHRFSTQIEYIRNNPEVDLIGGFIEEFNENLSESLGKRIVPLQRDTIRKQSKKLNPFNHVTVCFKKNVISSVGGYQHHLFMEDYNLWLRVISANHNVANIDDIFVNVRAGSNMITRRKGWTYIKSELKLAKLKRELKIDNYLSSNLILISRCLARILPNNLLIHL